MSLRLHAISSIPGCSQPAGEVDPLAAVRWLDFFLAVPKIRLITHHRRLALMVWLTYRRMPARTVELSLPEAALIVDLPNRPGRPINPTRCEALAGPAACFPFSSPTTQFCPIPGTSDPTCNLYLSETKRFSRPCPLADHIFFVTDSSLCMCRRCERPQNRTNIFFFFHLHNGAVVSCLPYITFCRRPPTP